MMIKNDLKQQARILKTFLKEKNISIPYSLALEAIAKINGHKDWNTMSAISSDPVSVKPNKKDLFELDGTDNFYMDVKREIYPWHAAGKKYWQNLYNKNSSYLDQDYIVKFPNECFSRLWELTLIDFISQYEEKGLKRIIIKGKSSKPDFCFDLFGKRYYLEAICTDTGNAKELNITWEEVSGKARETPIKQNMERFCSALNLKAVKKYYDGESAGYQSFMEKNAGLIIAISMAKIPLHNQANNIQVLLGCIFGISPMKIPIIQSKNGTRSMGEPYYEHQSDFKKGNGEPIETAYFSDNQFSHISAILISETGFVFFPEHEHARWHDDCKNDFTLVHNPFADLSKKLPIGFFNVAKEVTATINKDGSLEICFKHRIKQTEPS